MIVNRAYQDDAIAAAIASKNGICVLPTGSGKSVICAGITSLFDTGTLVLQPSVEILESNIAKAKILGIEAEIYSASAGQKSVGKITYATIGSIIKKLDLFSHVRNVVIDECHLVNAKGGMYEELITKLNPERLIGLTATPYRLSTSSFGSQMKILTRTKPKLFENIIHVSNPSDLVKDGFLLEPDFITIENDESMLRVNSAGSEFSESSQIQFSAKNNIKQKIIDLISSVNHKHILVFCDSVSDSISVVNSLKSLGFFAEEINAKTDKKKRSGDLKLFQSGDIRIMVNVGTLTTGYDFPALDCVIDASATMSAALHYQKIGRVVRPFPNKKPVVYCLAGNYRRLGNPMKYTMLKTATGNNYEVYSEIGRVTTRIMTQHPEYEHRIDFGKHKGKRLIDIDDSYIEWASNDLKGENRNIFYSELMRRKLFCGVINGQS